MALVFREIVGDVSAQRFLAIFRLTQEIALHRPLMTAPRRLYR